MTPPAGAARSVNRVAPGKRRAPARHPRRISGPARSSAGAAVALQAPGIALPRQRPARARTAPVRKPRIVANPGIALRAAEGLRSLSDSSLLDRLIRGRLWIGMLAFALIGIVAMQLLVLDLNTGVGRSLAREALLQRENAQIGIEDSMASAGERVEPAAVAAGMTMAAPGTLHFVVASPADVERAAAALAAAAKSATQSPQTEESGDGETANGAAGPTSAPAAEAGGSTTTDSESPTSSPAEAPTSSVASQQGTAENAPPPASPSGAATSTPASAPESQVEGATAAPASTASATAPTDSGG
jgi:hypothetical protein